MDGEQVWRDAYALIRQEVGVWVRRQPASTSGGRKRQLGVVGVFIVLARAGGNGPKPIRRHSLQAARENEQGSEHPSSRPWAGSPLFVSRLPGFAAVGSGKDVGDHAVDILAVVAITRSVTHLTPLQADSDAQGGAWERDRLQPDGVLPPLALVNKVTDLSTRGGAKGALRSKVRGGVPAAGIAWIRSHAVCARSVCAVAIVSGHGACKPQPQSQHDTIESGCPEKSRTLTGQQSGGTIRDQQEFAHQGRRHRWCSNRS